MRIRLVTEGSLEHFRAAGTERECDLLMFGFEGLGEVDYRRELAGEPAKLEVLARLSREAGCTVLSGCTTISCGLRSRSIAAADRGRLLGVADMLHVSGGGWTGGAHLKVLDTSAGKIGLCVGEDLFYPAVASTLSLCDADLICCAFGPAEDSAPQLMARACAFWAGVPVCMCAAGIAQAADARGEVCFRSARRECAFELTCEREYRLTTVRARGLSRPSRADD